MTQVTLRDGVRQVSSNLSCFIVSCLRLFRLLISFTSLHREKKVVWTIEVQYEVLKAQPNSSGEL